MVHAVMKVCSHDYNIRCKRTAPQWKQIKTQTVIVINQSELQFIGNTAVTALCDVSCPYQLGSSLCAQLSRVRERGTDLDDSDLFLLPVAVEKSLPARSKSALRPCMGVDSRGSDKWTETSLCISSNCRDSPRWHICKVG